MGESSLPTPVRMQSASNEDLSAQALGFTVAGVLKYHISVLDRENRLESGTGNWKDSFFSDRSDRERAVHESVLRTVRMAVSSEYYNILELLAGPGHMKTADLAHALGVSKLTLAERVSDLVSAGLVSKVPEADQVSIEAGGVAVVEWVRGAVAVAVKDLGEAE